MNIFFELSENKKFLIHIPDFPAKINYFYPEGPELHKFDEATISLENNESSIVIKTDTLDEILCRFYNSLCKAIVYDLELPNTMYVGQLGSSFNRYLKDLTTQDLTPYWMLSGTKNTSALLYSAHKKIYLEVVPSYPWTFFDPEPGDKSYITFDEFMQHYKPYVVETIPLATAKNWRDQCYNLLKQLDSACMKT